jgi:hypothetical protein
MHEENSVLWAAHVPMAPNSAMEEPVTLDELLTAVRKEKNGSHRDVTGYLTNS